MFFNKKRNSFCVTYNCQAFLLFFCFISFISCKDPIYGTKKAYFDTVLEKVGDDARANHHYTEKGMAYLDSVFENVKGAGIIHQVSRYMDMQYYTDDHNLKMLYIDSSINLLEKYAATDETTMILYADLLHIKGSLYFEVKNYDEAIKNFTLMKIAFSTIKTKDTCDIYKYYHSMANILYAQQKFLLAASFFRMKYKIALTCFEDPYLKFLTVQENIDNTGICFAKAGLPDSATWYYNATLDYISQSEKTFLTPERKQTFLLTKCVVYANQADILFRQNKYEEAEKLYLQSIKGTKETDKIFTISTRLSLASMYLQINQVKKAGSILQELASTIDTTDVSASLVDFYRLRSKYLIKTNQPFAAHAELLHSYNTKDSIEKRDRQFNATDITREFENKQQKAANEVLQKENEIKNSYLLVAVITAILALLIVLMVWHNLKRTSHYAKNLAILNREINQKNDDLQKTLKSLEESHRENNRIMRVVAHDLKNPISAIRTLVYTMLKKEKPGPVKESLELVQTTCIDAIALIRDLLDNKRNISSISKELVDIGRLIEQSGELFAAKAMEKKQQLILEVDHPLILVNRQKILRVISNIVNNAIKFSPQNSDITIRLERKDNVVLLSVQDKGIGIPADLKEGIFSINSAISRIGTEGEESHGLGLSISRTIVEEHNGRLWFESEEGKGSVFYVELPYLN